MPHPASSGTGYLTIAAWLQLMGEEEALAVHGQAAREHRGLHPFRLRALRAGARKGERLIGIGFDMRGAAEKTKGAPLDLVAPKEGIGWEMEATAIVKGTKKLAGAKKVADWAATQKANELYWKYYAIVAHPAVKAAPPNYPAEAEAAWSRTTSMDGAEPRAHARRVVEALRIEGGAEVEAPFTSPRRRERCSPHFLPYRRAHSAMMRSRFSAAQTRSFLIIEAATPSG